MPPPGTPAHSALRGENYRCCVHALPRAPRRGWAGARRCSTANRKPDGRSSHGWGSLRPRRAPGKGGKAERQEEHASWLRAERGPQNSCRNPSKTRALGGEASGHEGGASALIKCAPRTGPVSTVVPLPPIPTSRHRVRTRGEGPPEFGHAGTLIWVYDLCIEGPPTRTLLPGTPPAPWGSLCSRLSSSGTGARGDSYRTPRFY